MSRAAREVARGVGPPGFVVLALDGVYVRDGPQGILAFHPLPAPTRAEVTEVARRTAARLERILRAHGRSLEQSGQACEYDRLTADEPTLAVYYAAVQRTETHTDLNC